MRSVALFGCVLLLLVPTSAFAKERRLSHVEKKFLRAMIDALASENEDVREGATAALSTAGTLGITYLFRNLRKIPASSVEHVRTVILAMGKRALPAVEKLRRTRMPRGEMGEMIREVRNLLRALPRPGSRPQRSKTKAPPRPAQARGPWKGLWDEDEKARAAVDAIIFRDVEGGHGSSDPEVKELIALGRPAIPRLIAYLEPLSNRAPWHARKPDRSYWAEYALSTLCGPDDVSKLASLIQEGWVDTSGVLEALDDPRAVPALSAALARGICTYDIASALLHFHRDVDVAVVRAFLNDHGLTNPPGMGDLLVLLWTGRDRAALPAILRIARAAEGKAFLGAGGAWRSVPHVEIALACALLGRSKGIPLLIALLARDAKRQNSSEPSYSDWGERAGEALNQLTGQWYWKPGSDLDLVVQQFTEWWQKHRDHLKWNEDLRRYDAR